MEIKKAHKLFISSLEKEGRSPATLLAYGKDIEQLTDHLLREGLNDVNEVKLEHLEKFMNQLAERDYTNKSISRKTNSTKTFFKFLASLGHIVEDAADRLKHPKVDIKAPRILSKMEYRALRDAAREDKRTFTIIEVMLQTGVTISELAEMKVEHLKIEESMLHIPAKNAKFSRSIPLNKAVKEALNDYLNTERITNVKSEHVFITKTGNPLLVRNIRSTIDRFFKKAGIEKAKVNDLRHTFVAHHLKNGTNLLLLSKIAGHKRVSTTEKYLEFVEIEKASLEKTELDVL